MTKIILDLCGGSGAWSAPYKAAGYDVRLITRCAWRSATIQAMAPPKSWPMTWKRSKPTAFAIPITSEASFPLV